MKFIKQYICALTVFVLAAVSAKAETWFTALQLNGALENNGGTWSEPADGWSFEAGVGTLSGSTVSFTTGDNKKAINGYDTAITTKVLFTAIDGTDGDTPVEFSDADLLDEAKAGLTVVERPNEMYEYWAITYDGNTKAWAKIGNAPSTILGEYVDVTVATYKDGSKIMLKYAVGADFSVSCEMAASTSDELSTIEYRGECALKSLYAKAWSTAANTETIAIAGAGNIAFDRAALRAMGVDVDVTDDATIAAWLNSSANGEGENGYLRWQNIVLGLSNSQKIGVVSSSSTIITGQESGNVTNIVFNFGLSGDGISYDISDGNETVFGLSSPEIEIGLDKSGNSVVYDVTVKVNGVAVDTVSVGVMETGTDTSGLDSEAMIFDLVAVPWKAFDGSSITVADLLDVKYLMPGDTLQIWNGSGNSYDEYELQSDRTWSGDAATRTIPQGSAVWIYRHTSSRIILVGNGMLNNKPVQVAASATELIGNTSIVDFNLNNEEDGKGSVAGAHIGDQIVLEDVNNPRVYEFKNNAWGYNKVSVESVWNPKKEEYVKVKSAKFNTAESVIKAGVGFWYINSANDSAVTITLPTK